MADCGNDCSPLSCLPRELWPQVQLQIAWPFIADTHLPVMCLPVQSTCPTILATLISYQRIYAHGACGVRYSRRSRPDISSLPCVRYSRRSRPDISTNMGDETPCPGDVNLRGRRFVGMQLGLPTIEGFSYAPT